MVIERHDDLDDLLRPVLSGLPGAAVLLREVANAPAGARRRPCHRLAARCDTLDDARTRTMAQVTRLPAAVRADTIKCVQAAAVAQHQMLAVARVATHGPTRHVPDRSLRSSRAVVRLADRVQTIGLLAADRHDAGPDIRERRRLTPSLDDPADPCGQRRQLVRMPAGASGDVDVRLHDLETALADLSAELDVMMGHLIVPVQWRLRPTGGAAPVRPPLAAGSAGEAWRPAPQWRFGGELTRR